MIVTGFTTFVNLHIVFSRIVLLMADELLDQEQKIQISDGRSDSSAAAPFTDVKSFLIVGIVSFRFGRVMALSKNICLS